MKVRVHKVVRAANVTRIEDMEKLKEADLKRPGPPPLPDGVPTAPMIVEGTRPVRRDQTQPVRWTMMGDLLDGRGKSAKVMEDGLKLGFPMVIHLVDGDRLITTVIKRVIIEEDGRLAVIHTATPTIYEIFIPAR